MEKILFCCPACGGGLSKKETALVCPNGHSYDLARGGYVHLLPPNKMHAKIPGDNKEMVDARRRFLQKGYYAPFQKKLCALAKELTKAEDAILDIGCGEGYYTAAMEAACPNTTVWGIDISKFAVKAAAGAYKNPHFAVASAFAIPFGSNAAGLVTNVFAPVAEKELCRVLQKGRYLLLAVPGARHLFGMKAVLYEKPYENQEKDTPYEGFTLMERSSVKGVITPTHGDIWDLFTMTPYYWKTDMQGGARLKALTSLETEIHFDFLLYKRDGDSDEDIICMHGQHLP